MAKTKEYWREYYAKNKEKKRLAAKARKNSNPLQPNFTTPVGTPETVVPQVDTDILQPQVSNLYNPVSNSEDQPSHHSNLSNHSNFTTFSNHRFQPHFPTLKKSGLIFLVGILSFQLLNETRTFYSDNVFMGWIKAGSLEALILFFSLVYPKSIWQRFLYRILAFGICLLSLYAMSASELDKLKLHLDKNHDIESSIRFLENSLKRKGTLATELVSKGRLTQARESERDADKQTSTLIELQKEKNGDDPSLHGTTLRILVRVFLMIGNVLVAQSAFKRCETIN